MHGNRRFHRSPNQSLDIIVVRPPNFFGEKHVKNGEIYRQMIKQLQQEPSHSNWFGIESPKQKWNDEIARFEQLLQSNRDNGAQAEDQFETSGLVFNGAIESRQGEDVDWRCSIFGPVESPEELIPDVEGVVAVVGQEVGMNEGIEMNNGTQQQRRRDGEIPSLDQRPYGWAE